MEEQPQKEKNEIKYLIGPKYYETYKGGMKLMASLLTIGYTSIAVIDNALNGPREMQFWQRIKEMLAWLIVEGLSGMIYATFWATLFFVFIERLGTGSMKVEGEKSKVERPKIDKKKISKRDTLKNIASVVILTVLLGYGLQLMGWYEKGPSGMVLVETVFEIERLKTYLVIIVSLASFELIICLYKLLKTYWNKTLVWMTAFQDTLVLLVIVNMMVDSTLFNPGFLNRLTDLMGETTMMIALTGINIILIIFILIRALGVFYNFSRDTSQLL